MNTTFHIGLGGDGNAVPVFGQHTHFMLTAKTEEFALQIVIGFKAVVAAGGIQNPVSDVYQIQKMAELFGC